MRGLRLRTLVRLLVGHCQSRVETSEKVAGKAVVTDRRNLPQTPPLPNHPGEPSYALLAGHVSQSDRCRLGTSTVHPCTQVDMSQPHCAPVLGGYVGTPHALGSRHGEGIAMLDSLAPIPWHGCP
jgi:hypothetical protein